MANARQPLLSFSRVLKGFRPFMWWVSITTWPLEDRPPFAGQTEDRVGGGLSDAASEKGREMLPPGRRMGKGRDKRDRRVRGPQGTTLEPGGKEDGLTLLEAELISGLEY